MRGKVFYTITFFILFSLNNFVRSQNAAFNMDVSSGCGPLCVTFSDQSTNPVSWYWDFGDGNNSTVQYPMHCYTLPGMYQVTLAVTFASSTGTATGNVTVYPNPVAAFTSSSTNGNAYTFTDQSTGATTWMWSFGDTTFSSLQNPSHTYSHAGLYTTCLVVANSFGCVDSTCQQDSIYLMGVHEYDTQHSFSIFPVPSSDGNFTLELDAPLNRETPVIITNTLGETVLEEMISGTKSFDLSKAANGIYFVRVGNAEPEKLVIEK